MHLIKKKQPCVPQSPLWLYYKFLYCQTGNSWYSIFLWHSLNCQTHSEVFLYQLLTLYKVPHHYKNWVFPGSFLLSFLKFVSAFICRMWSKARNVRTQTNYRVQFWKSNQLHIPAFLLCIFFLWTTPVNNSPVVNCNLKKLLHLPGADISRHRRVLQTTWGAAVMVHWYREKQVSRALNSLLIYFMFR